MSVIKNYNIFSGENDFKLEMTKVWTLKNYIHQRNQMWLGLEPWLPRPHTLDRITYHIFSSRFHCVSEMLGLIKFNPDARPSSCIDIIVQCRKYTLHHITLFALINCYEHDTVIINIVRNGYIQLNWTKANWMLALK